MILYLCWGLYLGSVAAKNETTPDNTGKIPKLNKNNVFLLIKIVFLPFIVVFCVARLELLHESCLSHWEQQREYVMSVKGTVGRQGRVVL